MQVADQISWSHGKHTIRAGFEAEGRAGQLVSMGLERGFLFYLSFADWLVGRGGCDPQRSHLQPRKSG